jgi:hypothetical protein
LWCSSLPRYVCSAASLRACSSAIVAPSSPQAGRRAAAARSATQRAGAREEDGRLRPATRTGLGAGARECNGTRFWLIELMRAQAPTHAQLRA